MPVTNLDNAQLLALLAEEKDLQLVDVRTPEEYFYLGHIPQARLLPLHELPARYRELDPKRKTVLICEHGVRSQDGSHYLSHLGFESVYNLTFGMAEWTGPREMGADPLAEVIEQSQ